MNIILRWVGLTALLFALCYAVGAAGAASFDMRTWNGPARAFLFLFAGVLSLRAVPVVSEWKD